MRYYSFLDIAISRLILGTGEYGSSIPEKEAFALLDAYVEKGGNALDTAEVYGDWVEGAEKSASEKCLGRWLRQNSGLRSGLFIATKGAHYRLADTKHISRVRPDCIFEDLDKSVDNLGVDCIDMYWLHRDDRNYPVQPIMDTLFISRDKGLIKHFGASNWTRERIAEANTYADSCKQEGFVANQLCYSYVCTQMQAGVGTSPDLTMLYFDEAADTKYFTEAQMPLFAYSSQAHGYITKVLNGRELSEAVRRSYDCSLNRKRAACAGEVAAVVGCSAEAVGLGYLFSRPYRVFAIIGPRTMAQLESSLEAADMELSSRQIALLENNGGTAV